MRHSAPGAIILAALGCVLSSAAPQPTDFDAHRFLRTYAGFSNQDLARVAAGTAVSRALSAEGDEVAVAAAVAMKIPRTTFVEKFRDIESFKRNPAVLAIGRFGSPPTVADMHALKPDDDDLNALRRCRPGDCDIRLDDAGIARLKAAGGEGTDGNEPLADAFREYLAGYAADYLQKGDAALMVYHDRDRPRRIAADLGPIVQRSGYFTRELAAMRNDVASFGGVAASTNEHMIYWSVEKVASTSVTSLTHAIIAAPAPGLSAIATRQIYGSHFFHASLGLTLVADASSADQGSITVIYINRTRVDAFSGLLGPVKRAAVRSRARSGSERLLRDLRTRLERH